MIFERQINRRIKKNLFVIYALFSVSLYLSTISIGVISYRISSSGFFYATIAYPDMKQTRTDRERERDRQEKTREDLSLLFFVLFLYPESFIHNLFFLALWLSFFLPLVVVNKILSGSNKNKKRLNITQTVLIRVQRFV
jgi:hypothetical protein